MHTKLDLLLSLADVGLGMVFRFAIFCAALRFLFFGA